MWRTLKEIERELEKGGGEVSEAFSKGAELGWDMGDKKEWAAGRETAHAKDLW